MRCDYFTYKEHTADVLIEVCGSSLERLYELAAKAVFELITDTGRVERRRGVNVEVEGIDYENLLYRWIEELLFYFDAEGMVFTDFNVKEVAKSGEGVKLVATAYGETFDQGRHEHRTIVKAMTYAQMRVWKEGDAWRATFVVDI